MKKISFTKAFTETKKFANEFNADKKNISADLMLIYDFLLKEPFDKYRVQQRKIWDYFKKKTGSTLPDAMSEYA